jgi:uncharacterized membrane protein YdbT with pleckstrin-like domain
MRTSLRENEDVVLQVAKHWVVLIKPWLVFIGSAILLITTYFSNSVLAKKFLDSVFWTMAFAGLYLWYAIAERSVDIWVVTNLRIIDESGIITHKAKESPLDKINNVQYRQTVVGRIFDFGDVEIQTAAEQGATINKFVSHPKLLHNTIVRIQGELKETEHRSIERCNESRYLSNDEMECPYCIEVIKRKAKVCKYCGKELVPQRFELAAGSGFKEPSNTVDSPNLNPRDWMS